MVLRMVEAEGIALAVFRWLYKRRKPKALEQKKPRWKWFPKYEVPVNVPQEMLRREKPDELLEERLQAMGFEHEAWTKQAIRFTRGKSWGDFHAKLLKIRLSFSHPLEPVTLMRVEVASVCLFDTGDLWAVAREARQRVESTES